MHQLGQLRELYIENNQIERFNVQTGLMPNLQKLSFDWFGYLSPPRNKTISRHTEEDDIDVASN